MQEQNFPSPPAAQRLLRTSEVAEVLQVSKRHIYALIARGELRPCRVGGAIRVHPADLTAYLDRLRGQQEGPPLGEQPAGDG